MGFGKIIYLHLVVIIVQDTICSTLDKQKLVCEALKLNLSVKQGAVSIKFKPASIARRAVATQVSSGKARSARSPMPNALAIQPVRPSTRRG